MSDENEDKKDDKLNPPTLPADVVKSLENLIARSGGSDAASVLLFNDNKGLRAEIRQLKEQLPAEGAVVLGKEDAALFDAYKELGKPEEVKTRLDEGETAKAEAAKAAREKQIARGAEVLKLQNNALLQKLLEDVELDVQGEGDKQAVSVKVGDKTYSFDDFAKTRPELEAALPALQANGNQNNTQNHSNRGAFLKQGVNGGAAQNKYERIRSEVKEKQEGERREASDLKLAGIF